MYDDIQIERSKQYTKYPIRYFPRMLDALEYMYLAEHIDGDIIRSIDFHFSYKPSSVKANLLLPDYQVRVMLKDDLIDQITTSQHSKLF